jgi:hypothetical protein
MTQNNILVLLHADAFTGVQHALSLAERVPARVFILRLELARDGRAPGAWIEEILRDLLASAAQSGVNVSYHTTQALRASELVAFIEGHHISLLIVGEEETWLKSELWQAMSGWSSSKCRVLEVKARATGAKEP